MSGDTVNVLVQSYYNTNSITTTNSSFNDVLNSLANGLVNVSGGAHGTVGNLTSSGSSVYTGLTSFLSADDPPPGTGYPKAYLNWIFLDDQFNYVSGSSGSVKAASATYPAATLNTVAPGGIQSLLVKMDICIFGLAMRLRDGTCFLTILKLCIRKGRCWKRIIIIRSA